MSRSYDAVDNPTEIRDWRTPSEWPAGAQPVTRKMQYDDLYRVTRVDYQYAGGDDTWVSPFAAENTGAASDARRAKPSPQVSFAKRVLSQSFAYDWLGNTARTDDDAKGFYDRSLGVITNGTSSAGPYQLKGASGGAAPRDGALTTTYDDAGNLTGMSVVRNANAPCLPAGSVCSQRFAYEWDEIGRLARARRWDGATLGAAQDALPAGAAVAELRYAYDGSDQRVVKSAIDAQANQLHTVYVFGSLELRRARFDGVNYERTALTESPYLFAHGVRLARLYWAANDVPTLSSGNLHVLLELPDHLGSSAFVIDRATGELVERSTYQAYGAAESDYRPERWASYRDDYRFTGKEEDVEVGLQYFGKRYYAPLLGRWVSADPLTIHGLGADANAYAYVRGAALRAIDPMGFDWLDYGKGVAVGLAKSFSPIVGQTAQAIELAKAAVTAVQQIKNGETAKATETILAAAGGSSDAGLSRTEILATSLSPIIAATLAKSDYEAGGIMGTTWAHAAQAVAVPFAVEAAAAARPSPPVTAPKPAPAAPEPPAPPARAAASKPATQQPTAARPIMSGAARDALGHAREQTVADLVGGRVTREAIKTKFGSSDVDVEGPNGELIAFGGPAKAANLSRLGNQLKVLQAAADERGVVAKAAFERGTPQPAIDLATKKLGAENVILFDKK